MPLWEGNSPDKKVHGASMGPNWGRQDPSGPHVGPINFAIWVAYSVSHIFVEVFIISNKFNVLKWMLFSFLTYRYDCDR